MSTTSTLNRSDISRFKLLLALSRTPHGVLDMATPFLGALLALGSIPPFEVVLLGLLTAFSGYTAVYALNDMVDYRVDRDKIEKFGLPCSEHDLDAMCVRHPMAQGLLSLKEGLMWTVAWGMLAFMGAYMLNPACAIIFIAACIAEAVYCLLLRVSYLRAIVSGMVKTAGGLAAVFAVLPEPPMMFVVSLFLWLFFWEIGGQNVPNDWTDMKEDRGMEAETIPVVFGAGDSALIILFSLTTAVVLSLVLFLTAPGKLSSLYLLGSALCGSYFLLIPAYQLYRSKSPQHASSLFNKASYYPVSMFAVVLLSSIG